MSLSFAPTKSELLLCNEDTSCLNTTTTSPPLVSHRCVLHVSRLLPSLKILRNSLSQHATHDVAVPFRTDATQRRCPLPFSFYTAVSFRLERQQARTDPAPALGRLCRHRPDSTRRSSATDIHSVYSLAAALKHLVHLGWRVPCALTLA
jgi:hypothetical protein